MPIIYILIIMTSQRDIINENDVMINIIDVQ